MIKTDGTSFSAMRATLIGLLAVALFGAGFLAGRIGPRQDDGPDTLAMTDSACDTLVSAMESIGDQSVPDADVIIALEGMRTELPEPLRADAGTLMDTYRSVAEGDVTSLSDPALVERSNAAAEAIVGHIDATCGTDYAAVSD